MRNPTIHNHVSLHFSGVCSNMISVDCGNVDVLLTEFRSLRQRTEPINSRAGLNGRLWDSAFSHRLIKTLKFLHRKDSRSTDTYHIVRRPEWTQAITG